MVDNDKYIVIVSGQRFVLSKAQVQFDSPNYFTKRFFGNTPESHSRTLELSRDPDLFRLVVDYLSDYWVIPLSNPVIPPRSPYRTLNDLCRDAIFYELGKLQSACEYLLPAAQAANDRLKSQSAANNLIAITGTSRLEGQNRSIGQPFTDALGTYVVTEVAEDRLSHADFSNLSTPQSCQGFTGIRELGIVQTAATKVLKTKDIYDWRLVGWKSTSNDASNYQVVIIVDARRGHPYCFRHSLKKRQVEVAASFSIFALSLVSDLLMTQSDKYVVIIRNERYVLTESQIQFDSPNYLTKQFHGDTPESQSRILELSRDPGLFKVILDYLSGYWTTSPTIHKMLYQSPPYSINHLLADAKFYELDGLQTACAKYLSFAQKADHEDTRDPGKPKYTILTGLTQSKRRHRTTAGVLTSCKIRFIETIIDFNPTHPDFSGLTAPNEDNSFLGIRELGYVQKAAKDALNQTNLSRWQLVGWKIDQEKADKCGWKISVMILLKDLYDNPT